MSGVAAILHLLDGRVAHPCVGDARACGHPHNGAARASPVAGCAAGEVTGKPAADAKEQAEEPESRAPIARVLTCLAVDAHEDVGATRREQCLGERVSE